MITTPTLKYYDHFLMKEIPSFRLMQSSGKKETDILKKEIHKIINDLQKVMFFKFGITAEQECIRSMQALKEYTDRLNELTSRIAKFMVVPDGELLYDDHARREYKRLVLNSIQELYALFAEIEPVKAEVKAFTANFNLNISFNVLQPLRRIVQMGFSFSQS